MELSPHLTSPEEPGGQFPVFHLVMGQQHWEPPEQLFFAVPLPCPSVVAAAAHRVAYLSLRIITAGDRKHLNTLELVAQVHFMHPYLQHALLLGLPGRATSIAQVVNQARVKRFI